MLIIVQGCLNPVTVRIPSGSLLDPSEDAAVVGEQDHIISKAVNYVYR